MRQHRSFSPRSKSSFQQVVLGNYGRPFELHGNATIRTGGGNDSISVENATLKRNLTISSGAGNDTIQLANSDPVNNINAPFVDVPARVRGDVRLDLGDGDDVVDVGAASQVQPGASVRFHVGGNLHIAGGSGNETLNFIDAKVDGRYIDLQTGTGNDKIELTRVEAARAQLLAELGDGDDTLTIANGAYVLVRRLSASGGRGHDDFELGTGVTRLPWLTLWNFEV